MNERKVIDLLKKLVSIPSYTGYKNGDKEVADFLNAYFIKNGIYSYTDFLGDNQYNVIARIGKGRKKIILNGHLDTVQTEGMTVEPFGEEKGNYIYGRGTSDMKAGIAAMAYAMILLKELSFDGEIIFVGVAAEENGDIGMIKFLEKYGRNFDYAIVSEPTNLIPVIAHKGIKWIKATFSGKSAHGSVPQKGINAVDSAVEFLNVINKELIPVFKQRKHHLLGESTITTGTINGGTGTNMVADYCEVTLDRRFLPNEKKDEVINELRKIAEDACKNGAKCNVYEMDQTAELEHIPFNLDQESILLKKTKKCLKEISLESNESYLSFWTEAASLYSDSTPSIVIGPGDPTLAHAPDEKVAIQEVVDAVKLYRNLCMELLEESNS